MLKSKIKLFFSGTDARTLLLRKNILANFVLKGISGIITLALVPLTLKCLGAYSNGVWLTLSSILLLVDNLDIGLGNGLRNKLTEFVAFEKWQEARVAITSTFLLLLFIIVPFMLFMIYVVYTTDIYAVLNIQKALLPNLNSVLSVCIILFCATFIMKTIGNIYLGMQLPAVSNFLVTGGHPLILIGTYYMYVSGVHSLMAIVSLNMSVPLLMYILAYPYTFYHKYPQMRPSVKCFSLKMSRDLFSTGLMFFLNQISSSIVVLSSNILISRWYNPDMVTPYQIVYRYFSVPFLIFTVINSPNWSATADAYQRNDIVWIRNSVSKMNKILLAFFVLMCIMLACSGFIYRYWIGDMVTIDISMTISVGLYMFIMMVSLAYCYYLNGIGALRLQLICMLIGIMIYIVAAYCLNSILNDVVSIPIAMLLSLLPSAVCNRIQFMKIINKKAVGIWKK